MSTTMGYSSRASLMAAVDSLGSLEGLSSLEDKLDRWRFTEGCSTSKSRNILLERKWIKSVKAEMNKK